jgi:hypothetical protein
VALSSAEKPFQVGAVGCKMTKVFVTGDIIGALLYRNIRGSVMYMDLSSALFSRRSFSFKRDEVVLLLVLFLSVSLNQFCRVVPWEPTNLLI